MIDLKRTELKKKIDGIVEVSSIPTVIKKIIAVIEGEHSTRSDLENAISHDPALATRVIEIANNTFYGFSGRIKSIHGAIAVIGFDLTKSLAISTAIFGNVSGGHKPEIMELWSHSFAVAEASARLAELSGIGSRAVSFTAGLLHDIGRPLFFQLFGDEYINAIKNHGEKDLISLEMAAYGASHTDVGTWFSTKCALPDEITTTINYHHTPELYDAQPGFHHHQIVYLADLIVVSGKGVPDSYNIISPEHSAIMKELRIDGHILETLKKELISIEEEAEAYIED